MRQNVQRDLEMLKIVCDRQTLADEENPLLEKLTNYHEHLSVEAENILTEKL